MIFELPSQFLLNRRATLQVDPVISTSARPILSILNVVRFIHPKLPLFSRHPTLVSSRTQISQSTIHFIDGKSLHYFLSMFYPAVLMKIPYKSIIVCSLSSPVVSSQALSIISFPCFKCFLVPVHLLIIHFSLFTCSGMLKISQKARLVIQDPFNLF